MKAKLFFWLSPIYFSVYVISCSNSPASSNVLVADTVVKQNEISVKYNYKYDTLHKPTILEASTIMVTDSILQLDEFKILKYIQKRGDSINYMNCVNGDPYLLLRHYTYSGNILDCTVYIPGAYGWFFLGNIYLDKEQNLIFEKGKNIIMPEYLERPIDRRITMKIYIPKHVKFNKFLYKCPV